MSWTRKNITKSAEVAAATTVAETYTPPASIDCIWINHFCGESAFSKNSVVKLVWKWNHATESEQVLWSTKGSGDFTEKFKITDCDGVRKLAIVLENGETGSVVMSGHVDFMEGDYA